MKLISAWNKGKGNAASFETFLQECQPNSDSTFLELSKLMKKLKNYSLLVFIALSLSRSARNFFYVSLSRHFTLSQCEKFPEI